MKTNEIKNDTEIIKNDTEIIKNDDLDINNDIIELNLEKDKSKPDESNVDLATNIEKEPEKNEYQDSKHYKTFENKKDFQIYIKNKTKNLNDKNKNLIDENRNLKDQVFKLKNQKIIFINKKTETKKPISEKSNGIS